MSDRLYTDQVRKCFDHIKYVGQNGTKHTFYTVPMCILGEPYYNGVDCIHILKQELKNRGFRRKVCDPGNVLFISWDPNHQPKSDKKSDKKSDAVPNQALRMPQREVPKIEQQVLSLNPDKPLSRIKFIADLIKTNPKYDRSTINKGKAKKSK
ncbi:hypothetical protein HK102_001755 [Quaeritorhiza haematococci]|nr:hypothetical protein HK102_001755 [Quaeritorhiza haematococci]